MHIMQQDPRPYIYPDILVTGSVSSSTTMTIYDSGCYAYLHANYNNVTHPVTTFVLTHSYRYHCRLPIRLEIPTTLYAEKNQRFVSLVGCMGCRSSTLFKYADISDVYTEPSASSTSTRTMNTF